MPDAFEFPGVLRAVVPLMRREGLAGFGSCVIDELVALTFGKTLRTHGHSPAGRLPGLPAIVRALNHLPEPGAGLRCVQPVRIRGRPFNVVNLPSCKIGAFQPRLTRLSATALARSPSPPRYCRLDSLEIDSSDKKYWSTHGFPDANFRQFLHKSRVG